MIININNRDYELHFGWAFLKYANKINGLEVEGLNIGVGGMTKLELGANLLDPETLYLSIKCALASEQHQPSNADLERFIEEKITDGTYEEFYTELWKEVKKAPVLNQAVLGKAKASQMNLI